MNREDLYELDEIAEEAGGYVAYNPNFKYEPRYDYRKMLKYCEEKGIEPLDLTIRELQHTFIIA